jgi:hypothetical protein
MADYANTRGREPASAAVQEKHRPPVKMTVPLAWDVHVRLTGLAALRGQTLGEVAAEFIEAGVAFSGVRVFLQGAPTDTTEKEDAA